MARELLIIRHAKSEWNQQDTADFDRPLKKRGIEDAHKMGLFLKKHNLVPDYIISSTARRAMETARLITKTMGIPARDLNYDSDLYLCQPHTMIRIFEDIPSISKRAMVVGHNPSLDQMVEWLSEDPVEPREDGKLMTTTAVAHFNMPQLWRPLKSHCGHLENLWRPKDI